MSVEYFIDTNLFIYPLERLDQRKADIAERLIEKGIATGNTCISFQVVQECLNTAIRKAEIPLTTDAMKRYLNTVLMPLYRIQPNLNLYLAAVDIQARYRFAFYDSLIVSAALEAGCKVLYS
ncbi:MAG: PIN domain-containing protein, partial [Methylococcales bacterium]